MTAPPPDNLGHHVHVKGREFNWPLFALAGIVALLSGIVVWLALTRHAPSTTPQDNRQKINRLACEVVALGGKPVPGTRCSPTPKPKPTRPRPHVTASPAAAPTTVIVPGGGATTVVVPRRGGSGRPGPGNGHHHAHHGGGGGSGDGPSPSPSSSPLVCVTAPILICPSVLWVFAVPLR